MGKLGLPETQLCLPARRDRRNCGATPFSGGECHLPSRLYVPRGPWWTARAGLREADVGAHVPPTALGVVCVARTGESELALYWALNGDARKKVVAEAGDTREYPTWTCRSLGRGEATGREEDWVCSLTAKVKGAGNLMVHGFKPLPWHVCTCLSQIPTGRSMEERDGGVTAPRVPSPPCLSLGGTHTLWRFTTKKKKRRETVWEQEEELRGPAQRWGAAGHGDAVAGLLSLWARRQRGAGSRQGPA